MITRHRITVQDVVFVLGIILLIGYGAYEYSFTASSAPPSSRRSPVSATGWA